ncbi:MAG: bifunctional methylenetetrahydrofolate dehydrogenase/methenyltetrahydrofolate cyclohydrolase [Acetilactobacillus jinshanensis]
MDLQNKLDSVNITTKILKNKFIKDIVPKLAIIMVGNDRANLLYVHMKERKAKRLGLSSFVNHLPSSITQDRLIDIIHPYNQNPEIDGILVQSPLPGHINERQVDYEIDPQKDVDGFTPENMGKLLLNEKGFFPIACTPKGIMVLLKEYRVRLKRLTWS